MRPPRARAVTPVGMAAATGLDCRYADPEILTLCTCIHVRRRSGRLHSQGVDRAILSRSCQDCNPGANRVQMVCKQVQTPRFATMTIESGQCALPGRSLDGERGFRSCAAG